MTFAQLSPVQAAIINNARAIADDQQRKDIKHHVFNDVKARFGIPDSINLKAETDAGNPNYLIVKVGGKKSRNVGSVFPLDANGQFTGTLADSVTPPAPVVPVDNRRWFKVSVDALISLYKDETYLNGGDAVDLPADVVLAPFRDDFAAAGTDVFIKADPDAV